MHEICVAKEIKMKSINVSSHMIQCAKEHRGFLVCLHVFAYLELNIVWVLWSAEYDLVFQCCSNQVHFSISAIIDFGYHLTVVFTRSTIDLRSYIPSCEQFLRSFPFTESFNNYQQRASSGQKRRVVWPRPNWGNCSGPSKLELRVQSTPYRWKSSDPLLMMTRVLSRWNLRPFTASAAPREEVWSSTIRVSRKFGRILNVQ